MDAFLSKFILIQEVTVGKAVDSVDKLIEFLKKCKMLKTLVIKNSFLEQTFYEALHTACASLETLEIRLNMVRLI